MNLRKAFSGLTHQATAQSRSCLGENSRGECQPLEVTVTLMDIKVLRIEGSLHFRLRAVAASDDVGAAER
jgi:hypothetical protein